MNREDEIIIVSGLPRSGTSLMMRMLEKGGLTIVQDNLRQADQDNPLGYFELEKVKELKKDSSFLDQAKGKVIKIITMLLRDLPKDKEYRIILMKRHLDEILMSQKKMLDHKSKKSQTTDEELKKIYQKHLTETENWLKKQTNLKYLVVSYNQLLANPQQQIVKINNFLGNCLNQAAILKAIDTNLYRNKVK